MAEPNRGSHSRCAIAGGLLVLAVLTSGCVSSLSEPSALPTPFATPTPPAPPRVALISIDGLRPDALTGVNTPNILALAQRGSYTFAAQTVFPSTTLPGHTSMLTGLEPSAHGITFDEYRDSFQLAAPTVFSLVHLAGKRAVMVVGKDKLRQLAAAGSTDSYTCATRGDVEVVNEAVARLPLGFDLLFVHLPQVDLTGHASGWMSAEYLAQLHKTDEAVGRLVALLPPGATVILTADHGGQHKSHGTNDSIDMTIPWIIAGPRVAHHGPLTRAVRTVDTALTVLSLLSVPAPVGATGKLVSEAFEAQ
jgi:predicted AlkP superfamily pyrophosphatase or phosphodiesterase